MGCARIMLAAVTPHIIRSRLITRVLLLQVDCHIGLNPSQRITSVTSTVSYTTSWKHTLQPKQVQVVCESSGLQNIRYPVLPLLTWTMDSERDSETLDVREKIETVPTGVREKTETVSTGKLKRRRENYSVCGTSVSPPSKRPQPSKRSSSQPPKKDLKPTAASCMVRSFQEPRKSTNTNDYNETSERAGSSEHSKGECELSGHSDRLIEGNILKESNQHATEPEVACIDIINPSSFNNSTDSFTDKVADTRYQKMPRCLTRLCGSNLSLSKSLSEDSLNQEVSLTESLDQDVSLAESIDQDSSLVESEVFSSGIFETECESLSTSQILPDDSLGKIEEKDAPFDHTEVTVEAEAVSTTKKDKNKKAKEKKKRRNKREKNIVNSVEGEQAQSKNLRPNYFLAVQVTNADIHKTIVKVQEDMVAHDESLARSFVDAATSHLTLLVAHIDTEESLIVAQSAMDECGNKLMEDVKGSPLLLTFSGVNHFSNQVVFAQLVEDEHYHRLLELAECARLVFSEKGVCMPDTRTLNPHLTIAKLSKAPRVKGKRTPRRIDPSSYKQHLDLYFGSQIVCGLQLLSMNKPKDEKRYYYTSKEILFGVECKENTDHSLCCFPRRPLLKSRHSKHERSYSTGSNSSLEGSHSWLLPTVGVMTALAAVVALSFVVVKFRSRH